MPEQEIDIALVFSSTSTCILYLFQAGLALPHTIFLAKYYNEASVANREDNLATIFPLKI
jgi:hypothetical protein